ncbi:MAG: hypothetical protein WC263_04330 [Candidatus Micrarchaeia archaeon]|jgi:hypothetical protein
MGAAAIRLSREIAKAWNGPIAKMETRRGFRSRAIRVLKEAVKNRDGDLPSFEFARLLDDGSKGGDKQLYLVASPLSRNMKKDTKEMDVFLPIAKVQGGYVLRMADGTTRELREHAALLCAEGKSLDIGFAGRGFADRRYNFQGKAIGSVIAVAVIAGGPVLAAVLDILKVLPYPATLAGLFIGTVAGLVAISRHKRKQIYDMRDALEKLIKTV